MYTHTRTCAHMHIHKYIQGGARKSSPVLVLVAIISNESTINVVLHLEIYFVVVKEC
jgi:hypothetical protein